MNTRKIQGVVKGGLGVAAGLVAANMVGKLGFAQTNPIIKVALPIVGAIAVKKIMGKSGDMIALGMAAQAVNQGIKTYAPGVASTVGLSGTGFHHSTYLPGVSGGYAGGDIVFD